MGHCTLLPTVGGSPAGKAAEQPTAGTGFDPNCTSTWLGTGACGAGGTPARRADLEASSFPQINPAANTFSVFIRLLYRRRVREFLRVQERPGERAGAGERRRRG